MLLRPDGSFTTAGFFLALAVLQGVMLIASLYVKNFPSPSAYRYAKLFGFLLCLLMYLVSVVVGW